MESRSYHTPVRLTARLLTLVLLLAGMGCTLTAHRTARLSARIGLDGIPIAVKRVERYPQLDYWNHFIKTVYFRPGERKAFIFPRGSDQKTTSDQWGAPDWVRRPFRSLQDEKVQEWVYLDKVHIFQFIGHQLVFEGPLTDYEQVLLARGYPQRVEQTRLDSGNTIDIFIYYRYYQLLIPAMEEFHFTNGILNQSQEGN